MPQEDSNPPPLDYTAGGARVEHRATGALVVSVLALIFSWAWLPTVVAFKMVGYEPTMKILLPVAANFAVAASLTLVAVLACVASCWRGRTARVRFLPSALVLTALALLPVLVVIARFALFPQRLQSPGPAGF